MAERFLREDALRVEQDLPINRASTVIFFLQREKTDRRIPAGPFSLFIENFPRRNMDRKYNKNNISFAKELRKNMQKEERHLWYVFLSSYTLNFSRQKVLGRFIADFYCSEAKLILICIVFLSRNTSLSVESTTQSLQKSYNYFSKIMLPVCYNTI